MAAGTPDARGGLRLTAGSIVLFSEGHVRFAREAIVAQGTNTMYTKPKLEQFGTFRELTQLGLNGAADGFAIRAIGVVSPGCTTFGFEIRCPGPSAS